MYKIVLVHPGIHISTAWAFANSDPCKPATKIKELISQPIEVWKQELKNDFEEPVFKKYSEIKKIKDDLYDAGAIYSSLSGSGSAVYGIFEKGKTLHMNLNKNYFIEEVNAL